MATKTDPLAYVRTEEAPLLPAPRNMVGWQGWMRTNLFSTPLNSIMSVVLGALILWYVWDIFNWAILTAIWSGTDREACLLPDGGVTGACWPLLYDKFPQWMYGFYPHDQRWRVNIVFIVGVLALIPMLIPSMPYKKWNALFLLLVFPLMTLILLTGGNFDFSRTSYLVMAGLMLVAAAVLPVLSQGLEEGVARNKLGLVATGLAVLPLAIALLLLILGTLFGILGGLSSWLGIAAFSSAFAWLGQLLIDIELALLGIPGLPWFVAVFAVAGAVLALLITIRHGGTNGFSTVAGWLAVGAAILAAMALLDFDFGLVPVETSQWGGMMLTLVVSVTGIVFSLPLGILLALGRRSEMPVVKLFSVIFIELWRGVPLITVLFFSSVMLPLFLPEGVSFDKLLRALIGVALFSAAYMAEVVRSGLQAIPKGQYEGAMAVGLSYWQMMNKIILPQALKVSIPNIVGNFISLFKDTTLVSIIGLFDLLGIVRAGLKDSTWATPSSVPTGYFALAAMYWILCFGMSRYSMYTERRLNTGHKR
jgi:general L-amino acid transport system permease protein